MRSISAPGLLAGLPLLILVIALTGCDTPSDGDVTAPMLAEAKGGQKGPPDRGTEAPSLVEFYVFEDASGQEMVHIVVDATAAELGYQASLDHFQNGHVDGGSGDSHYEFFELLAPRTEAQAEGSHHHADVPFEGLIRSDPRESFLDHPYLDVDGQGGDAFVFRVLAWRGDEAETGLEPLRFRPSGVVDGGLGLHPAATPRSYGIFQGSEATHTIWVEALTVASVECSTTTVREGKGKNRTERTVTRVDVHGTIAFVTSDGSSASPWVELHVYDADSGTLSPRLAGTMSGEFSHRLDVEGTPGSIHVVLDYVYPGADWGVYDPASNGPASSAPGLTIPAPLAVSAAVMCPS